MEHEMKKNSLLILIMGIIVAGASGAQAISNSPISQGVKPTSNPTTSATQSELDNFVNQGVLGEAEAPSASELKVAAKTEGQKALRRALTKLSYEEKPSGSNCNFFSHYFGKGCQSWCADFVSWAFDGNGNKKLPWANVSAVSSIYDWGKAKGHIVKRPLPGDIFILKGSGISHTGIVRSTSGSTFTTVEGNTSNRVRSLRRAVHSYTHFVRVP
jgi:CHAP domain